MCMYVSETINSQNWIRVRVRVSLRVRAGELSPGAAKSDTGLQDRVPTGRVPTGRVPTRPDLVPRLTSVLLPWAKYLSFPLQSQFSISNETMLLLTSEC